MGLSCQARIAVSIQHAPNAMQCNAMQCNAMQCNAMQCNASYPILSYPIPSHPSNTIRYDTIDTIQLNVYKHIYIYREREREIL